MSIEKQITYNCPDKIKRGKLMRYGLQRKCFF